MTAESPKNNELQEELWAEQHQLEQAFRRILAICRTRGAVYPDRAVRSTLCEALHGLSDHLGMLVAIKESGGFLSEELVRAPRLAEQVEELGHEWEHLYELVCQLVEMAERRSGRRNPLALLKAVEICCNELRAEYLQDEKTEQEIVARAFNVDVGGEA